MKTRINLQHNSLVQNFIILFGMSLLMIQPMFAQWSPNTSSTSSPISRSGQVTIGSTSSLGLRLRVQAAPSWRFEVAEFKAGSSRSLRVVPNTQVNGYNQMTKDGDFLLTWTDGQAGALNANAGLVLGPWNAQKTGLRVAADGRVSIGTKNLPTNLGSYNLFVEDGILTEEVSVQTGWADYVFEPEYKLLSLEEVMAHIQAKGHLPNTPSAGEIEKQGGVKLGETSLKQQEKIEEIFLHLIDLNDKIKALEKENALLQSKLKKVQQ